MSFIKSDIAENWFKNPALETASGFKVFGFWKAHHPPNTRISLVSELPKSRYHFAAMTIRKSETSSSISWIVSPTQTLQTLQKIREAQPLQTLCPKCASDDPPEDIDVRRERLARRIEAFMESRTDEEFEE